MFIKENCSCNKKVVKILIFVNISLYNYCFRSKILLYLSRRVWISWKNCETIFIVITLIRSSELSLTALCSGVGGSLPVLSARSPRQQYGPASATPSLYVRATPHCCLPAPPPSAADRTSACPRLPARFNGLYATISLIIRTSGYIRSSGYRC